MKRMKPGEAAAGELDLEEEQRYATWNMVANVAGFVAVVTLLRVGAFTELDAI